MATSAAGRVFTRRFGKVSANTAASWLIFEANDQYVWIVRDVVIHNASSTAATLAVFIQAGLIGYTLLQEESVASGLTLHWEGRQEILPGELLMGYANVAPWDAIATGYALTPATA